MQVENKNPAQAQTDVNEQAYLRAKSEDMQWWKDAKFGLFVCWGPVSLEGTEIGNSRGHGIQPEIYDNLYRRFNPVKFDPNEWVRIAKSAGMKYLVFVTKHLDGFAMWDTKLNDYKITSTLCPFGRDIVKGLADACHKADLGFGVYFITTDWWYRDTDPNYRTTFDNYQYNQLRELCSNYGKVDIIWFDSAEPAINYDAHKLFKMIRHLQPHVIINNRSTLAGDFNTPEQIIGSFELGRPWETCMTIGTQWAWKPNDTIKSVKRCIQALVRTAGGGGNFLFNVRPYANRRDRTKSGSTTEGNGCLAAKVRPEYLWNSGRSVQTQSLGGFNT
jgi:alpha-L-fucosidase